MFAGITDHLLGRLAVMFVVTVVIFYGLVYLIGVPAEAAAAGAVVFNSGLIMNWKKSDQMARQQNSQ